MKGPDVEVVAVGGKGLHLEHGIDQAAHVRLEFFSVRSAVAIRQDEEVDLVLCRAAFKNRDDLTGGVERGPVHEAAGRIDDAGVDRPEASIF